MLEENVTVGGKPAFLRYPRLDIGGPFNLFDGDEETVARTMEANPFIIELTFQSAQTMRGYDIVIGSAYGVISTYIYRDDLSEPVETITNFDGSIEDPWVYVNFDDPVEVQKLRIEVLDHTQLEIGHVHVWELILR